MVNCRLKRSMTLHDALHGLRAGRGTGTSILEAKLTQQLAGIAHRPLFQVFLDVQKVYDSLNRGHCMEILRENEMGENMAHLIAHHWEKLILVPRAKSFLRTPPRSLVPRCGPSPLSSHHPHRRSGCDLPPPTPSHDTPSVGCRLPTTFPSPLHPKLY